MGGSPGPSQVSAKVMRGSVDFGSLNDVAGAQRLFMHPRICAVEVSAKMGIRTQGYNEMVFSPTLTLRRCKTTFQA